MKRPTHYSSVNSGELPSPVHRLRLNRVSRHASKKQPILQRCARYTEPPPTPGESARLRDRILKHPAETRECGRRDSELSSGRTER
jgi:hypothetical protein